MGTVERGVVKSPNNMLQGLGQTRSMTPGASAPMMRDPNNGLRDGDPSPFGGRGYAKGPSPVHLDDHRFNVNQAKMPSPPSAVEPGKGAIPIYGFNSAGMPNKAMPEKDSAK